MSVELKELLDAGAHFGHQKMRWNPKMSPFIFTIRDNVHIFDLEKTAEKLDVALDFVNKIIASGGKILFVGTKAQGREIIQKSSKESGMPYVVNRWPGGLLTNFETIRKQLKKLKDLRQKKETGELEKYTKKEQMKFDEEIARLEKNFGGIENIVDLPQAILVFDAVNDLVAVKEAKKINMPVVAIVDSNANPDLIDYPIPANDDAIKSIQFFADQFSKAIVEATKKEKPEGENKKEETKTKKGEKNE